VADLTQFLQLFNPLPGNRYLQVTTLADETTTALADILKSVGGTLNLVYYCEDEAGLQKEFINVNVQKIPNFSLPFRALPREHDMVILKDIFHLHKNQKQMLKIVYTTLANTANVIIMEKKGVMDVEAIKNLLESNEFRAPNGIEVLEGYDLVMAKKMHMWGNGL
jgi:hypothetical protein